MTLALHARWTWSILSIVIVSAFAMLNGHNQHDYFVLKDRDSFV